jgi:Putative Flp pilus-assembly TadE/G-like
MAVRAAAIRHALRDETGGVTVLALFSLILTVLCIGFAIDTSNLYRHQAMLRTAADAAAHAGASALARGATDEAAEAAAIEILSRNMAVDPESLLADGGSDLRALVVNPADGTLSKPDPDSRANAMLVSLQQSKSSRNPIPTLVLGLFGFDSWSAGASSVAVVAVTRRCENAAGLFAQGPIAIGSGGDGMPPGDGMCVHSQESLSLPRASEAIDGTPRVSLPSRGACAGGACEDAAEINLIMPDIGAHVARLADGFARPALLLREERAFFAKRPMARDLEPLLEVGAEVRDLQTGGVVTLSPFRFRLLREFPPGLVYLVLCGQPGAEVETGGREEIIIGEWEESPALRDIALVTSCPIRLAEHARIEGALVISTADDSGLAGAAFGARIGDPKGACDDTRRSIVMSTGDLVLPSQLALSNLAAVAAGDIQLGLNNEPTPVRGRGISLHAGGQIRATGTQSLAPCPGAADPLLPTMRVISHTMPPLDGWITPLVPEKETDLPGTAVERLEFEDQQS